MRKLRFLFYLMVLFFVCFWFSGGKQLFSSNTINVPASIPMPNSTTLPHLPEDLDSSLERIMRVINLPKAVNTSIQQRGENYVLLEDIALPMQQAIIAVEDNRFYTHPGFDIEAMMRATLVNLQFGHIEEGASTITQQLIKNLFLSHEQSLSRKTEEFILAVDLEMRYPKEKILELYLNTIYFGSGFYGIYDASQGYFGKSPDELTIEEASMLAGLPNAPSLYSPYVDFQAAKERQAIVLETMVKAGYINPSSAKKIRETTLHLAQ